MAGSEVPRVVRATTASHRLVTILGALLVLLWGSTANTSNTILLYSLRFETCSTRLSGTEQSVTVRLYSKTGYGIHETFSGHGDPFNVNETDVFELYSNNTPDIGPVCRVGLALLAQKMSNKWQLRKMSIRHVPSQDVGVYVQQQCKEFEHSTGIGNKLQNYTRLALWGEWSECSCDTKTRLRRRKSLLCGAEKSRRPKEEVQMCEPSFSICGSRKLFAIFGSILGFLILILTVVGIVCCVKNCQPSGPTVQIQMPGAHTKPMSTVKPPPGSNIQLDVIRSGKVLPLTQGSVPVKPIPRALTSGNRPVPFPRQKMVELCRPPLPIPSRRGLPDENEYSDPRQIK